MWLLKFANSSISFVLFRSTRAASLFRHHCEDTARRGCRCTSHHASEATRVPNARPLSPILCTHKKHGRSGPVCVCVFCCLCFLVVGSVCYVAFRHKRSPSPARRTMRIMASIRAAQKPPPPSFAASPSTNTGLARALAIHDNWPFLCGARARAWHFGLARIAIASRRIVCIGVRACVHSPYPLPSPHPSHPIIGIGIGVRSASRRRSFDRSPPPPPPPPPQPAEPCARPGPGFRAAAVNNPLMPNRPTATTTLRDTLSLYYCAGCLRLRAHVYRYTHAHAHARKVSLRRCPCDVSK